MPGPNKSSEKKPASVKDAGTADKVSGERPPQLDGLGKPYITLAQFLKKIQAAGSGGEAKVLARTGVASVNGDAEKRPGRKLHEGDRVRIAKKEHVVHLD